MSSEREQEQRESASRLQALKDQAATERATELADIRRQADEEIARARREATEAAEREHAARPAPVVPIAPRSSPRAAHHRDAVDRVRADVDGGVGFAPPRAGAVASRAVVFLVNGDRLRSWRTVGFPQLESQPFDSSIAGTGMLAKAVQTGDADRLRRRSSRRRPFAAVPADASALAVPLHGRWTRGGVLYADTVQRDARTVPSPAWRDIVATLARHASAVVALVTALRTVQALGVPTLGKRGSRRTGRATVRAAAGVGDQVVQRGGRPHGTRTSRSAVSGCVRRSIARADSTRSACRRVVGRAWSVLPAGAGANAGRRRPGAARQRLMPRHVAARVDSSSPGRSGSVRWPLSGQSPGGRAPGRVPSAQTPDPPRAGADSSPGPSGHAAPRRPSRTSTTTGSCPRPRSARPAKDRRARAAATGVRCRATMR